ncbi:MAG TPA: hypothetical protein PK867_15510 [Pirellulales bacterium]|nr:hypothetical protein [Pirellulales bacterium]
MDRPQSKPPALLQPDTTRDKMPNDAKVLRPPAEALYAEELAALAKTDREPRPPG